MIHDLAEVGKGLATARCGTTMKYQGQLPPEMTGWASRVTCEACKGQR